MWEVAIRFDPPAAHDDETALFYASSDPGKQLRVDAFDPLQVGDGIGGEHEVVVLVHPLERGAEGRLDLLQAFLPLP